MKLSFWQFLGALIVLAGGYYFYTHWWVKQDRTAWINHVNDSVYKSDDELHHVQPAAEKGKGWL